MSLGEDFGDVPLLESLLVLGSLFSLSSNKSMFSPLTRKKKGEVGIFLHAKQRKQRLCDTALEHSAVVFNAGVQRSAGVLLTPGCTAWLGLCMAQLQPDGPFPFSGVITGLFRSVPLEPSPGGILCKVFTYIV